MIVNLITGLRECISDYTGVWNLIHSTKWIMRVYIIGIVLYTQKHANIMGCKESPLCNNIELVNLHICIKYTKQFKQVPTHLRS